MLAMLWLVLTRYPARLSPTSVPAKGAQRPTSTSPPQSPATSPSPTTTTSPSQTTASSPVQSPATPPPADAVGDAPVPLSPGKSSINDNVAKFKAKQEEATKRRAQAGMTQTVLAIFVRMCICVYCLALSFSKARASFVRPCVHRSLPVSRAHVHRHTHSSPSPLFHHSTSISY